MVRLVVLGLLISFEVARAAPPAHCPANEKAFHCHRLALGAHVGLDGPVDLQAAKTLYAEACAKGQPASCNNLAVLALAHPELGKDVDARAMFVKACDRLDHAGCENARRVTSDKALAIELSLVDSELTVGAKRWGEMVRAACRAGDVFRCDDATSRQRVATVLAGECRGGADEVCFDAAMRASDDATFASLMAIACNAHEGKACHALATRKAAGGATDTALGRLWQGACTDENFNVTEEDGNARSEACARWGKAAKPKSLQLRAAKTADAYCRAGTTSSCAVAEDLYDRAGAHAKAFAIAKQQCDEGESSPACRDLAERYVLGNGTAPNLARGIEMLGGGCPADLAWATCKKIGSYLEQHGKRIDAANSYASYCQAGNDEACYLRARAFEADDSDGTCGNGLTLVELKASYDALCSRKFRDSCRRSAAMCGRAMAEFNKPDQCSAGVGDGTERFSTHYHAMIELCPKASWTPAIRAAMRKIDEQCKEFEASGGQCER